MDCSSTTSTLLKGLKNYSITLKVLLIIFLILLLMIPKSMMISLVKERMSRGQEVISEVGSKWGGPQNFQGPLLSIPSVSPKGEITNCHLYPENVEISTKLINNELQRGIFTAVLYTAEIQLTAKFKKPQISDFSLPANQRFNDSKAILSFGIRDVKGIAEGVSIRLGTQELNATPGLPVNSIYQTGFHIPIKLTEQKEFFTVIARIPLKGSEAFTLVPTGKSSVVNMNSKWPDPSFTGDFLPITRTLSQEGFSATWNVHALQKKSIQQWTGNEAQKSQSVIGVKLIQANGFYQKILRIIKYALLFLCFTFAAVFISERLVNINIHPLQYMLTGIASLLFYTLLLSLSEHMPFNTSYLISTLLITILISTYAKGIFKKTKIALTLGSVTTSLYLFLFITLQMEDYALLMGSSGLFLILSLVMYLTRNINKEGTCIPSNA
jgi:inner membrane protein